MIHQFHSFSGCKVCSCKAISTSSQISENCRATYVISLAYLYSTCSAPQGLHLLVCTASDCSRLCRANGVGATSSDCESAGLENFRIELGKITYIFFTSNLKCFDALRPSSFKRPYRQFPTKLDTSSLCKSPVLCPWRNMLDEVTLSANDLSMDDHRHVWGCCSQPGI